MSRVLSFLLLAGMVLTPLNSQATLQTRSKFVFPADIGHLHNSIGTSFATNSMNSLNEYGGSVIRFSEAVTISEIGFNIASLSSFVGTAKIIIETIDPTNGDPSGTEVGTGTAFTPATGWTWLAMTANASLSANTYYFVGVKVTAYTSGSFVINSQHSYDATTARPYQVAGSSSSTDNNWGTIGAKDASGNVLNMQNNGPMLTAGTAENWKSTDNPDRRGVRFKLPFPARLAGLAWVGDTDQNFSVILYDSNGTTALVTSTYDGDEQGSTGTRINTIPLTPTSLTKDVFYRLVILPTSTTANNWLYAFTVSAAADLDGWDGGQNFHWTQVNGAPSVEGDWTNTTTKRPLGFCLLFDQFGDDAGGGGATTTAYTYVN